MHPNAMQRLQILEILYQYFEKHPGRPWVNVRQLKELGEIDFTLAALKELGHIKQNGFNYCILGSGILVYESAND